MTGIAHPQGVHAMPDTMIERVARAICEYFGINPDQRGGTWDGGSLPKEDPAWTAWVDLARAVVEALREPTEAMVREGFRNNRHVNPTSCGKPTCVGAITLPPVKAYQAMIDAILAEGQPGSPALAEKTPDAWRAMDSAPRDGTAIWGKITEWTWAVLRWRQQAECWLGDDDRLYGDPIAWRPFEMPQALAASPAPATEGGHG